MRHIHLDPLGGLAGDMFVAALLHAFPDRANGAIAAAAQLAGVECRVSAYSDGTLAGARFAVDEVPRDTGHQHHPHAHWSGIRSRIERSGLDPEVRRHAVGIFGCLADAEAQVHGTTPDEVTFHEVGAADSIADIVAAAWVVASLGPVSWSVSPLPAGSGRVQTAHGVMPVPAPATALLLEGFATHDDGIAGERVTPTGAAILRHLNAGPMRPPGIIRGSGFGFGTRRLPGISNCLRVLVLDTQPAADAPGHRELAVIAFEVDDQSGEELASGLDHIRAAEGVHDVLQMPAYGKKGRMTVHVQVLVRPDALDDAVEGCFRETTTIGLRTSIVQGRALSRRFAQVHVDGRDLQVKLVERPGGLTGKVEADHTLSLPGHAARTGLRRSAEKAALS